MTKLYGIIITFTILCLSKAVASNNTTDNQLPHSIDELKQYYKLIQNFEQRGILSKNISIKEKQLYIEVASN